MMPAKRPVDDHCMSPLRTFFCVARLIMVEREQVSSFLFWIVLMILEISSFSSLVRLMRLADSQSMMVKVLRKLVISRLLLYLSAI